MSTVKKISVPALLSILLLSLPAAADDAPPAPAAEAEATTTSPARPETSSAGADVTAKASTGVSFHYLVETSMATTYVFRGVPQYLEKTDPSSQTTLGLTFQDLGPGSLSLGVWNATSVTGYRDQPGTKLEFDLTATYSMALTDELSASLGYIGYFYPEADPVDGAHELAGTLTLASDIVTPTLGVYAELVRLKGVYVSLGVARDFVLGSFTITPSASVAVSGYDAQDFGLNDAGARLQGKWSGAGGLYAGAAATYAYNGVAQDGSFGDRSTFGAVAFVGFSR